MGERDAAGQDNHRRFTPAPHRPKLRDTDTLTCGSPRGIVGNRDPLGDAVGVRGTVIGHYDCQ